MENVYMQFTNSYIAIIRMQSFEKFSAKLVHASKHIDNTNFSTFVHFSSYMLTTF